MKCREASRRKSILDNSFKQLAGALKVLSQTSPDLEVQSHVSRYLCVAVSAFLEVSLRSILAEHTGNRAAPEVIGYVESQLGTFYNANTPRVLELLGRFRTDWKNKAESALTDEVKDAVNSVVENKNRIAHGDATGISFARISAYYAGTVEFLEKIEEILS